jgi:hypothetical protein
MKKVSALIALAVCVYLYVLVSVYRAYREIEYP